MSPNGTNLTHIRDNHELHAQNSTIKKMTRLSANNKINYQSSEKVYETFLIF